MTAEFRTSLFEVATGQRACRCFTSEDVGDDLIEQIVGVAVHAPSAENSQPWVFVVVRSQVTREALSGIARRLWSSGARRRTVGRGLDPRILAEVDRGVEAGFGGAPVLVVVGADTSLVPPAVAAASVFPAVQNLLLAASALGLGSALTSLAVHSAEEVRAATGMPPDVVPLAIVPIGRPARRLGPPRREPAASKMHRDSYGTPWSANMNALD